MSIGYIDRRHGMPGPFMCLEQARIPRDGPARARGPITFQWFLPLVSNLAKGAATFLIPSARVPGLMRPKSTPCRLRATPRPGPVGETCGGPSDFSRNHHLGATPDAMARELSPVTHGVRPVGPESQTHASKERKRRLLH